MRLGTIVTVVSLTLIAAVGCGGMDSANARPENAGPARGAAVKVVSSRYGKVIADSKGEALYLFTKDGRGKSQCYGACAAAWPPLLTKGKPRAGKGITAARLGTTRRRDGKLQVTYRGQPLYYYVHDKPGLILCQDVNEFGGDWLVVAPSGRAIR
jgi:predicted lipoprotein with Yx(FWY)xxD motif